MMFELLFIQIINVYIELIRHLKLKNYVFTFIIDIKFIGNYKKNSINMYENKAAQQLNEFKSQQDVSQLYMLRFT